MKKFTASPKFLFGLIILLGIIAFGFLHPSVSHAAILQEENQAILEGRVGGSGGFDDKAFNLNQLGGTVDSMNYLLSGRSEAHPELISLGGSGAVGGMGTLIGKLYTPPISSVQYLAYLKQNLGLATPAYAQQTGFGGLQFLLPVWRTFRNAAYLIYVLLFIITGLLIMFRVKISPQAVIGIQTALPKLAFTLILITLSYAIAGLMIDVMYVFIYLIINLITQGVAIDADTLRTFQTKNVFDYWATLDNLGFNLAATPAAAVGKLVDSISDITIITGILSKGAQGIATAVFLIAILFSLFRLFFELLKSYVWILVLVIFGPFILLAGAMPGGGMGISSWIRGLLSNLVVFPTAVAMFALAAVFMTLAKASAATGWTPPLVGGGDVASIQSLIGLGMVLLAPSVTQMMNDAFKPPPFPYGTAIGQSLGAGPAFISGAAKRGVSAGSYEMGKTGYRRRNWRALF
ncbi:MAG: hypothetical protein Q8P89_03145 [bacterium]|nr:hypothetical protein [bacterium]